MSIAESIKILRDTYSITQAELGEIAGLSGKAIGAWESGRAEPRIGAVEKIANHFGIPKTKVLGWDDDCEAPDDEGDECGDGAELLCETEAEECQIEVEVVTAPDGQCVEGV